MKLKELKRTVNVCWSPAEHYPVTLAAGSAAQQVDSSFSSSSYLELYSLNLEDPGSDLELKSSLQTQQKFQKIVWSGSEIIVGGCDGGLLQFYSSEKLLNNATDCLLGSSTKHNGNVSSLDINPYQKNLLASGASDSEIFIWDLNNTSQPMAPGNRSQPYDHVQGLAWNQQVQHILGSTFATRCVVWDLRKNEPIMKLSDSQSRTRWRALAWHPSVATQLCIASEDDQVPVIQLWDLRLAASPLVTLEGHNKGVMALSWCKQDPDLMLSGGKDGRVLCWNPNNTKPGGELLTEVSQQQQWVFDVSWSPRDPSLIVSSSFDQQVNVYSLLGGSKPETSTTSQSNIMDSFGGMDSFSQLPAVSRVASIDSPRVAQLPVAPKWLKRSRAAKFAFGGKLVTFDRCPQEAGALKQVYISQVVSDPEIVERATELDSVLGATLSNDTDAPDKLAEYCLGRGDEATDQTERFMWFFFRANFLSHFRLEVLNLLGFKPDEIPSKFKSPPAGDTIPQHDPVGLSRGESTETEAELSTDTSTDLSEAHTLIERKLANLDLGKTVSNVVLPNGEDTTSLICRALVCGNLEEAVELCLDAKRISDALIIASLGSQELLYKVQKYHLNLTSGDPVSLISGTLLLSQWESLVSTAAPKCWKQTLAALVTHTEGEALAHYCEMLGDKLAQESEPTLTEAATICYLIAMSPDALVSRWNKARNKDVNSLAKLTSLALLARRAALHRGRQIQAGGTLESILNEYASRLASQGCLQSALHCLEGVLQTDLRDRLMHALGNIQDQRRASQQQQPQQHFANRSRTVSSHSHHKGHYGTHNNVLNSQQPNYTQEPRYEQPWASTPAQPWAQAPLQPPSLPPTQPQPAQPPRPASGGPAGGITSRSKYKVDPSVQSSPLYNQYAFNNNPIQSQPQSYGYNSPIPDQYQNSSVPNTFAPINPNSGLNPLNPGLNPVNPALNLVNPGLNPGQNPVNLGLNPINPSLNPVVNGNYYNPQQQVDPAMQATQIQTKPPQSGWNDPPMLSSNKSKHLGPAYTTDMSAEHAGTRRWGHIIEHRHMHGNEPKQEVQSQAPITHPLFGVEPPQHVPLAPATGQYPGQQYPGQQQYPAQQHPGQQYPGQYEQQYDQQYQQPYQQGVAQGYQQQPEPPRAAEPPAPVVKAPVPEQHAVLQAVLDGIRTQCTEKAINPQMKRKLEDVQRRLETLYDMLREYKLSESALQTLHTCVQYTQSHDYSSALSVTTALATGADFAAAASFLPGLKVLLQLAQQLQVYVS